MATEEEMTAEEKLKMEERLAIRMEEANRELSMFDRVNLRALLLNPLPLTTFTNTFSSLHTNDHQPVVSSIQGNFHIIKSLQTEAALDPRLGKDSMFLLNFVSAKSVCEYTSESELHRLIGHLLFDLMRLVGWRSEQVAAYSETYMPHAKYLGRYDHKSDFWILFKDTNRPILAIEVKSPRVDDVLNNDCVLGQIVDCMIDVACFHGQRDVYGITTTVKQFRIHWLPSADNSAKSTYNQDLSKVFLNEEMPVHQRHLISSEIYDHNDPNLIPLLMSVFVKCYNSPRYLVDLISHRRMYITLNETAWEWSILSTSAYAMDKLSVELDKYTKQSTSFIVLNHLSRGKAKLVWMALAGGSSRIVVLKQFSADGQPTADKECLIWKDIYGASNARVVTLRQLPTVVMPLVFQVKTINGSWQLDCDLYNYLYADPASPAVDRTPQNLKDLREIIMNSSVQQGYNDHLEVLTSEALDLLADKHWVHKDIKMLHFGVMPVFENGKFIRLKPVMMDFESVVRVDSKEAALTEMRKHVSLAMKM